jgi:hypothetical protein
MLNCFVLFQMLPSMFARGLAAILWLSRKSISSLRPCLQCYKNYHPLSSSQGCCIRDNYSRWQWRACCVAANTQLHEYKSCNCLLFLMPYKEIIFDFLSFHIHYSLHHYLLDNFFYRGLHVAFFSKLVHSLLLHARHCYDPWNDLIFTS